ncbi:MAG TPA: hypothetical protein DCZ55_22940 [Cyanobacteria bacterium UBA11371]|nr:hypothetical protein [Cyanobacteria bacterium UBA11371]HBE32877.1 hypothetical protein [Cyanobacteria bacterium UBA11368]
MNKNIFQRAAVIVSLTAVASVTNIAGANSQPLATHNLAESNAQFIQNTAASESTLDMPAAISAKSDQIDSVLASLEQQPQSIVPQRAVTPPPVPGTVDTSAATLLTESTTNPYRTTNVKLDTPTVAQAELDPGRPTRSGSSYIGIGGNIGIGGDTALGEFGFAVFSKIGLTQRFSLRPAIVVSGDADILIPVTFDFPIQAEPFERINLAPYVGAGAIITTSDDSTVGLLLTGGVDLPLTEQFTATAGLNLGFNTDTVGVGLIVGVGYNFGTGFRF